MQNHVKRVVLSIVCALFTVTASADDVTQSPLWFGEMVSSQSDDDLPWSVAPDQSMVVLVARVFYSEFRGCPIDRSPLTLSLCHREWRDKFSAIENRRQYRTDWQGDLREVINWGCNTGLCEINGLSVVSVSSFRNVLSKDDSVDQMVAVEAVAFAAQLLSEWEQGTFESDHSAHSWAMPKAATDAYFESKCRVPDVGLVHYYFADCGFAPSESDRPVRNPRRNLPPLFLG